MPGLWSLAAQAAVPKALLHLWHSNLQGPAGAVAVLVAVSLQLPCSCRHTAHEAMSLSGAASNQAAGQNRPLSPPEGACWEGYKVAGRSSLHPNTRGDAVDMLVPILRGRSSG